MLLQRLQVSPALLIIGILIFPAGALCASDGPEEMPAPLLPPPPVHPYEIKGSEVLTWDSNPLLLPSGAQSIFGSVTSPELIINDKTPISSFHSDSLLNVNIFNHSDFDSTDFHEKLAMDRHVEQWEAGIAGNFDYDTTRTSEIVTYGLDLPRVHHTGWGVTPDIAYRFTSVDKITLQGSYHRSTYDNDAFVDYEVSSLSPFYEHSFDPKNKAIFTLNAQWYESLESTRDKVNSVGPTIGWMTLLSPRFSIRVDAGFQKSWEEPAFGPSSSSWDYIFDGDLSFEGEQDITHLIASRSQYPFANGTSTLLTAFSLTEAHALNKLISLTAEANYQSTDQPSEAVGINLDREYGLGAGLLYHLFEHWDMTANYKYKNETLTGISGSINDNTVLVGITYHPFL
jgi:hypothetical protein